MSDNRRKKRRKRAPLDRKRAAEVFSTFDDHAYKIFLGLFANPTPGTYCGLRLKRNGKQFALFRGREYLGQLYDLAQEFADNTPWSEKTPAQAALPGLKTAVSTAARPDPVIPKTTPSSAPPVPARAAPVAEASVPASAASRPLAAGPLITSTAPAAIPSAPKVMTPGASDIPPGWEEVPPPKTPPVQLQALAPREPVQTAPLKPLFDRRFFEQAGIKIDWEESARLNGETSK